MTQDEITALVAEQRQEIAVDYALRFLRRIKSNTRQMYAGNHNSRRLLEEMGYIRVVARHGQHYHIAVTEKGASV